MSLPLRFMLTGLAALLTGLVWLAAEPQLLTTYHYNSHVLALTHLFVLGWICSTVMGAAYQLVPVALETKLYSERLARWQFAFHVAGFSGMVWMFHAWNMKQVGHFGSVLAAGVCLFVYNISRTLLRAPKRNITAAATAAALVWLSLAVLAGLSIAATKCVYESTEGLATTEGVKQVVGGLRLVAKFVSRFDAISAMHAHAHVGVVGFFVMLIVGVSYRLVPMFTLSEVQSKHRAAWSVALLNLGLGGSVVTILLRSEWKFACALVAVTGLAIYAWELKAIVRARKRRELDWGMKTFLGAVALLIPVCALALVLAWPKLPLNPFTGKLENAYGFLGLIGVVTLAILGLLQKIVPFLVWLGVYSPHVGRAQLPTTATMCSDRLQAAGFWVYVAGLAAATVAILGENVTWARVGGACLAAGAGLFTLNLAKVFAHFSRPRLTALPSLKSSLA